MRVCFGTFILDEATRLLYRAGVPVPLEPKALELLALLIRRRPAAVSKQEIHDQVWPDTFVSESTVSSLVAQVRRALGGDGAALVRTVHGFGYAFEADAVPAPSDPQAAPLAAHVDWDGRILRLVPGENVLGRSEDLRLRIDVEGVSRRHARIVADAGRFTLEDLGSKNGTFLGDERLRAPVELADGDVVRFGHTAVVFCIPPPSAVTVTED